MSTTLKIKDETTFSLGGDDDRDFTLDVPDGKISVRELISARVYREVRGSQQSLPAGRRYETPQSFSRSRADKLKCLQATAEGWSVLKC